MKRLFVAISIVLALAFVTVLVIQSLTEAQSQRPRQSERGVGRSVPAGSFGAMVGQLLSLPASWWQVSVGIGISDEQLVKARPIYQEAWKKAQDLRKERPQNREEMEARLAKAKEINAEIGEKLNKILTKEQFSQYEDWEKKRQEQLEKSRERLENRQQSRPAKQLENAPEEQPESE
ncbi:hypothetical protein FJZ31_04910 [Candidatus Poribacteria bacterium]|nr:hypothetical protein [Candidatus Poribacteria bacterium]